MNRYPVYNADIRPKGFQLIELDGFVSEEAVEQVRNLLRDPHLMDRAIQTNYTIGRKYFSLEVLERKLTEIIAQF